MSGEAQALMAGLPDNIPNPVGQSHGRTAQANQQKLMELQFQKEAEGGWRPAMVLNLSPFTLRVETGLIQYSIPACPQGKDFSVVEITTARPYLRYRASHEQNGGIVERDYDVKAVSPIEQAYEFFQAYNLTSESEVAQGGVVIFEGTKKDLKNPEEAIVRVPSLIMRGKLRVLTYREERLSVLLSDASRMMKDKTLSKVQEGQSLFDNPELRKNLTDEHRTWARLAHAKRWIPALPSWLTAEATSSATICDGCSKEYRSRTGKCECGHVQEVVKAYKNAVIEFGHVRFDSLNAAEWKEVKVIKAQRDKNRGE